MQTDLQTLLSITGVVCGTYIISNLMRRKQKIEIFDEATDSELDDQSASQRFHADPLMDEAEDMILAKRMVRQNTHEQRIDGEGAFLGQPKKVIIDDSVADGMLLEAEVNEEIEEMNEGSAMEEPPYIALTVIAKKGHPFSGDVLFNALKANHLYYGKDKLFHRHVNDNPMQDTIYTVLSLVNPGFFDIDHIFQDYFHGIVLLMPLSNRINPSIIFEKMLTNARQLAVSLGGAM